MPQLGIIPRYRKLICVYQVTFDEKYFYIGSSEDLEKRICFYNSLLRGNKLKRQPKKLVEISKECQSVKIEVLEAVAQSLGLRSIEDVYIKQNLGNPLFINRNNNAFTNKGINWTQGEKMAISAKMKGIKRSSATKQHMSQGQRMRDKSTRKNVLKTSKIVINLETGIFYETIVQAARSTSYLSATYLCQMLKGRNRRNKTHFVYA